MCLRLCHISKLFLINNKVTEEEEKDQEIVYLVVLDKLEKNFGRENKGVFMTKNR